MEPRDIKDLMKDEMDRIAATSAPERIVYYVQPHQMPMFKDAGMAEGVHCVVAQKLDATDASR